MNIRSEIYIILSSLIFSTLGLLTRELNNEMGVLTQVSFRLSMAFFIYLALFSTKGISYLKIKKEKISKLFVTGFFGYGIMVVLISLSFVKTSYGNASTFLQLTPIFVIFLSAIFLKEKISRETIIAVIFAFCGALMIFRPDMSALDIGILFAAASAFLNSIYVILMRDLKNTDIRARLVYTTLFGGVLLLPFALIIEKTYLFGLKSWIILFIMAFANVIGYWLLNQGIRNLEANIVGILGVSQALFGIVVSYIIGEEFFGLGILGAFMILGSIIIINLKFPNVRKVGNVKL